jgi:hypothetical protein|tara:strand:+ start:182 stop:661 length:480 start_codon:yes stop_codon:yes gene_type:complete
MELFFKTVFSLLIINFIFLILNFFITVSLKKYTYDKFFIYVITYFILINFINLIYLKNIHIFTFQALFSVVVLLLYSGLYRSISVKIMVYLYLKKVSVDINSFYKNEFKEKSFNKRLKTLIDNGILIKKNKQLTLSEKGKKYLKIFKIFQSIYRIKVNG